MELVYTVQVLNIICFALPMAKYAAAVSTDMFDPSPINTIVSQTQTYYVTTSAFLFVDVAIVLGYCLDGAHGKQIFSVST